jgi:translation initiation factor IF-2
MNKGNKDAIFPVVLEIMKEAIFNRKDPIIMGVNVLKG